MVTEPNRPRNILALAALAADGEAGAGHALDLLNEELVRIVRLAGTPSIESIGRDAVAVRPGWPSPSV